MQTAERRTTEGVRVENWGKSIVSYPQVVVQAENVDEIVAIMKDPEKYPAPVRAIGSNHSTTRCTEANGGTIIDMTRMNRILNIGPDTVTAEAGALYIDIAKELQAHNLQFYVNVELGNMSIGSGSCGGT
ncbi:MAG: FAD-dependent oxidoreductase, partial [Dehalococcoidia bacterium]